MKKFIENLVSKGIAVQSGIFGANGSFVERWSCDFAVGALISETAQII